MSQPIDLAAARDLIDRLGFLVVPGPPMARGTAYLIAAIRPRPTLDHFDPESIDFWATVEGRGQPAEIDWTTRALAGTEFSWGPIRLVDRLGVANEFVCFGGQLEIGRIDSVQVALFRSDAPILARGGHSQAWDAGAHEIATYLARLRAAADPRGPLERRLAAVSPVSRYAAFVWDALALGDATERRANWTRADRNILLRERRRLLASAPADWEAGVALACDLSPGQTSVRSAREPDPTLLK